MSEIGKTLQYIAGGILVGEGTILKVSQGEKGKIYEIKEEGAKINSHIFEHEVILIS